MTETVTVPRGLLREVLNDADATAEGIQGVSKWAMHTKATMAMKHVRARIAELRKAAGLEDDNA